MDTQTPMVIEHGWTWEHRFDHERTPIDNDVTVYRSRLVCECGEATDWFRDADRAQSMANGHAIQGQQSLAT